MDQPSSAPEYLQPYREALAHYGPGFEATLWQNRSMQTLRFDVAMTLIGFGGARVADLGCGVGDLVAHLQTRKQIPEAYLGVDAQSEMVEEANRRQAGQGVMFRQADLVETLDLVRAWRPEVSIISGTLNTMKERIAWRLVREVFACSEKGVVFNFLSDCPHPRWRAKNLHPARRFRTARWLRQSLALTSKVSFRQDYLDGHDATIALQHESLESLTVRAQGIRSVVDLWYQTNIVVSWFQRHQKHGDRAKEAIGETLKFGPVGF